nr:methyltransferase domain-containing protein [Bacteroidota bacterium]
MDNIKKYYKKYPITHPAYVVVRIAGKYIRDRAEKYFSGKMIEIGCGDKSKQHLVGDFVREHIGLDHEDTPHDKSNVDLFGTAYEIPQDDEAFDCILSTAVLEHLEDPQLALIEAFRVLRPGGYAIYTAPLFWHLHEEPRDFFRYTNYGLEYLFKSAKFEVVEITPLSGFWVTFGSELSYYIRDFGFGPFIYISRFVIFINNIVFPFLNQLDQKLHHGAERWTWMYLVVAKKP